MSLNWQVVPLSFAHGQDSRTQPKMVMPSKWRQLINLTLSDDNTPRRRDGTTPLIAAATGNGLATRGSEILTLNGSALATYSAVNAANEAVAGEVSNRLVAAAGAMASGGVIDMPDSATSGGVTCHVWRDWTGPVGGLNVGVVNGINCALVDETTGAFILSNVALVADPLAICPRAVADGTGAFIVSWITSTGAHKLMGAVVTTAGAVGTATVLFTDANIVLKNFDAMPFLLNGSPTVFIAFRFADGTSSIYKTLVTRTGLVPVVVFGPNQAVPQASLAVANIRGLCLASYTSGTAVIFFVQDSGVPGLGGLLVLSTFANNLFIKTITAFTQAAVESNVTATNFSIPGGLDSMRVFCDQVNKLGTGIVPLVGVTVTFNLVQSGSATFVNSNNISNNASGLNGPAGPFISGKAFTSPGNTTVTLPVAVIDTTTFGTNEQNALFLLDGVTGVVVGRCFYGSSGWASSSAPSSTPAVGSSFVWLVPLVTHANLNTTAGSATALFQTAPSRVTVTVNTSLPQRAVALGGITYFPGGQLVSYDGSGVVEHGFSLFPENFSLTQSNSTGTVTNGVHQVVFVYEWIDGIGERHQSALSPPVSITMTGANNTITATVPTLQLTQKASVQVVAYMTVAAGTIFYRSADMAVFNSKAAATVTVKISDPDATLAFNEALYSQPSNGSSTLPSDSPPPCSALCVSQNRLWLLNADSPLEYRYSQELLAGFGLQFSGLYGDTTLGGLVPSESGGTVALSPLDEKTIIFCAQKLYVVYGQAPDSSGSNSTLSEPQEIASDVGCSDPLSILRMPNGLIFKSQKGWHLLGRDLSVNYIGDGVAAYDSYQVVSATLLQDRKECRFEVQSSSTQGATLVYSYLFPEGQWSVFFHAEVLAIGAMDAVWSPALDCYVWLAQGGGLQKDVPVLTGPDDFVGTQSPAFVTTTAQTSWLKVQALEGFQRVRRLYFTGTPPQAGQSCDSFLTITISFDDQDAGANAYGVTADLLGFNGGSGTVDLRHKLHVQKCKSVSFTFTDTPSQGFAHSLYGLQALSLEIGVKRGVNKLPQGQTV